MNRDQKINSFDPVIGKGLLSRYAIKYGHSCYGIDMNPFYLALAVPIFGYAMFRLRMFDIAPIARDRIFEKMKDPVIVLDTKNRIADFNTVAGELLPELKQDTTGLYVNDVLSDYRTIISKIITHDNLFFVFQSLM